MASPKSAINCTDLVRHGSGDVTDDTRQPFGPSQIVPQKNWLMQHKPPHPLMSLLHKAFLLVHHLRLQVWVKSIQRCAQPPAHQHFCRTLACHGVWKDMLTQQKTCQPCDLKWNDHVDHVCHKAQRMLGVFRRNFRYCSRELRQTLHFSFVRSSLEYACVVWDQHTRVLVRKARENPEQMCEICCK